MQPRPRDLSAESAAFYWFNSTIISGAGNPFYGRFVYEHLLPSLAPTQESNPKAWFVMFDGDCLADSDRLRNYFRQQDRSLLDKAKRVGENLCYVVAVLGQGTRSWDHIDQELRQKKVLGYMGMTSPIHFDHDAFLGCSKNMALVVAVRIDGDRFKRINYEWHTDDQLRQMGFQPYSEK